VTRRFAAGDRVIYHGGLRDHARGTVTDVSEWADGAGGAVQTVGIDVDGGGRIATVASALHPELTCASCGSSEIACDPIAGTHGVLHRPGCSEEPGPGPAIAPTGNRA